MSDERKTKAQLIAELGEARQHLDAARQHLDAARQQFLKAPKGALP